MCDYGTFPSISELHASTPILLLPISSRLLDGKVVRETRAWRDTALCDTNWAIHLIGAVLKETMKVDAGALVAKLRYISMSNKASTWVSSHLIVYVGNNSVTFCEVEQRKWPLSVNSHDGTLSHSIWVGPYPSNVPIKFDGCCARYSSEGRKTRHQALQ